MKSFKVSIKGLVPILQARHPSPEEEKEIAKRQGSKTSKIKVKALTDDEAFEMHAYKNKDGKFYQPSEMIESAMTKAAVNFKMEGKKSFKDVTKGGIIVNPIEIIHNNQDFGMDARWGRNPNTGGAIWVVRPICEKWSLDFTIDLLQDERISSETLEEILTYAGLYVGIGAWRPKFGRFMITNFEETK